jgi:hypothetical protein
MQHKVICKTSPIRRLRKAYQFHTSSESTIPFAWTSHSWFSKLKLSSIYCTALPPATQELFKTHTVCSYPKGGTFTTKLDLKN